MMFGRALLALFLLSAPAHAQNVLFPANQGDMIVKGATTWGPVPGGTAGCVLRSNGPTAAPTWQCSLPLNFQLPPMAVNTLWCNVSGAQASATACTISQILNTIDYDIQRPPLAGSIPYVGTDNTWHLSSPSTAGWVWTTQGPGVIPRWAPVGVPVGFLDVGSTTILNGVNGGVLFNSAGVLGNSTTLPSGLIIPAPTLSGTIAGTPAASGAWTFTNGFVVDTPGTTPSLVTGHTPTFFYNNAGIANPAINFFNDENPGVNGSAFYHHFNQRNSAGSVLRAASWSCGFQDVTALAENTSCDLGFYSGGSGTGIAIAGTSLTGLTGKGIIIAPTNALGPVAIGQPGQGITRVRLENSSLSTNTIALEMRNTAVGVTVGGLWRQILTGASYALQLNTAAGGDFSTVSNVFTVNSSGQLAATLTGSVGLPISTGLTGAGTGVITALGVNIGSAGSVVVSSSTTVGALGTCDAGANGVRKFVTDANATTFASVVAAGGANNVPVYCDGSAGQWKIG